jgi:hypothetical protein
MRKLSVLALLILVLLPWSCEAAGANELHQFVRGSWNDIRKHAPARRENLHARQNNPPVDQIISVACRALSRLIVE